MSRCSTIAVFLGGLTAACGGDSATDVADVDVDASALTLDAPPPDAFVDLAGPLFAPDHVVQVDITMAPADWDALRLQTRTIASVIEGRCLDQPMPSPFTSFTADVAIDGAALPQVAIKKKGFIGSLDDTKPSLKLDLDDLTPGQRFLGLERITLNNARQDASLVRQCLSYPLFAAAGIVAPRCNFAQVTVNGDDLGVYVHVESMDRRFVRSRFAAPDGPFFEGTLSDFRPAWVNTFEAKGGEVAGGRAALDGLTTALDTASDASLLDAIAPYVDLDHFLTFWATEIITNHWDGYANDRNNFFVYGDPTSGQLQFVPWGVDATLQPDATFDGLGNANGPVAVAAAGMLANRLFALPAVRAQFLARQTALLDEIWDEVALDAEVDRMAALLDARVPAAQHARWVTGLASVRAFIAERRADLTAAIADGPTWDAPLPGYPCFDVAATVSATFATTYGTLGTNNPFATGSGTFAITIDGVTTELTPVGASAGTDAGAAANQAGVIQIFGIRPSDGHILVLSIGSRPSALAPRTVDVGIFDGYGAMYDYDPVADQASYAGLLLGSVTLTAADDSAGAAVTGTLAANVDVPGAP